MDHAEARELLELAAAEPGGLDRLMAGDIPDAAVLAGHLAGCPECTDELVRLRRAAGVIGPAVRATPPPELRERTLALVAAIGRDRSAAPVSGPVSDGAPHPAVPSTVPARRPRLGWIAAIAALLVLAIVGTAAVVEGLRGEELRSQAAAAAALERITAAAMRVSAEPDARHVELASAAVSGASGTLAFSPSTRELVVVSTGLPQPPAGREFRCWVEVDGQRAPVGRMFFAGDLAFWVGPVDDVADLPDGARFGVTLVEAGSGVLEGDPAIVGEL